MKVLKRLVILTVTISLIIGGYITIKERQSTDGIVLAFGDLEVVFPSVPMFDENNWYPGKKITKSFSVRNALSPHGEQVIIKGINVREDEIEPPLSSVLAISIRQNGKPLYGAGSQTGQKTLADFFKEKEVVLTVLSPGETQVYDVTVEMFFEAGNEYQGRTVTFDIAVGSKDVGVLELNPIPTIPSAPRIPSVPRLP